MTTWEHSKLGAFHFDGAWNGTASIPLFAKFAALETAPSETVELMFGAYEPTDIPTEEMVSVANNTILNAEKLVAMGLQILHDDFHGKRADTGMWWHDDIEHLCEILDGQFPDTILDTAQGLYALLGDANILVQDSGYGYDKPCSIIGFESPIDDEHGIGILTDGLQVIGLGYRSDPCAFEE